MNKHAYTYHTVDFLNGLFDPYLDMIYVLTMVNSDRPYRTELNKVTLGKKITIQENAGFKNVTKTLYQQDTINDLNDAYYHCFLNASEHGYKNIMVLEDDFFFEGLTQEIVDDIGNFIKTQSDYYVYHLGPIFFLKFQSQGNHEKLITMSSSHGCIYSQKYIDWYIAQYLKKFTCMYDYLWNDADVIKYKYIKPVCFQVFSKSDNKKSWSNRPIDNTLSFLNLDKSHKSYYTVQVVCNAMSKIINPYMEGSPAKS
jgi:hypothetical protein